MADASNETTKIESPNTLEIFPDGKSKYGKGNRPMNNRVIIIIAVLGVVALFYIITSFDEGKTGDRQQKLKIANIIPAGDTEVLNWENRTNELPETERTIPISEPQSVPEEPKIVLREDGTLGTPNEIAVPPQTAPKTEKKNIKIVQRPPSERFTQSRNKMLEAMYADAKINLSTQNGNTSVNLANNGTEEERPPTDWEALIRSSNLFDHNDRSGAGNSGGDMGMFGSGGGGEGGGGGTDTNSTAMAHQDRATGFIRGNTGIDGDTQKEYVHSTRRSSISKYELKAGSIISGVMMGGINSDTPGTIVGQVSEHIYDTATGAYLLIPQGSRMVGTYDSHVVYGQNRIVVIWQRIIYPDGTSLNLEGMVGGDQSGYAGFKQKIDNHYSRLIGAALFASVFVAAGKIATEDDENKDGTKTDTANAVMETMANLGAQIAERNLNIAPTLRILPGYRFSIICTKDIAFAESYYIP
jgi:type IV secretion system protein VirB10